MGDLYIVTFSITFSTTKDYAALGQPVIGVLNKAFGEGFEDSEEKYMPVSVSANRYFMPVCYYDPIGANKRYSEKTENKVYIKGPTVLANKVIFFDSKKVCEASNSSGTVTKVYDLYTASITSTNSLDIIGKLQVTRTYDDETGECYANCILTSGSGDLYTLSGSYITSQAGLVLYGTKTLIVGTASNSIAGQKLFD